MGKQLLIMSASLLLCLSQAAPVDEDDIGLATVDALVSHLTSPSDLITGCYIEP